VLLSRLTGVGGGCAQRGSPPRTQLPKCTPGALGQCKLPCCLALARARLLVGPRVPLACVRAPALGALYKHGRQHSTKTTPNLVSEREARPLRGAVATAQRSRLNHLSQVRASVLPGK